MKNLIIKKQVERLSLTIKSHQFTLIIFLFFILGLLLYKNAITATFIWDDIALITKNSTITTPQNLPKLFTEDIGSFIGLPYTFYRPVHMVTNMFDYLFWGYNAKGYHLTNILLHIVVSFSLFIVIFKLSKQFLLSFIVSIFFLVHPVHTEAVAYISGRADLLVGLFTLLMLILYYSYLEKDTHKNWYLFYSLIFFFLALLSKESALIYPFLLLLIHYVLKKRVQIISFLPYCILAILYLVIRYIIYDSLLPAPLSVNTCIQNIPGFFVAFSTYFGLLLSPHNLHMEYGMKVFRFFHTQTLFGFGIFILVLICLVICRKKYRLLFFALTWFLLTLLPVSNIYPLNAFMAEHWLYFPSIGFFLCVGIGIAKLLQINRIRTPVILVACIVLIWYSHLTIKQTQYWSNPLTFYTRTISFAPTSYRSYFNLAVAHQEKGHIKQAIEAYKKAITLNNTYEFASINLAALFFEQGKKKEAFDLYHKVLKINPLNTLAHNNLALMYYHLGEKEQAMKHAQKAFLLGGDTIHEEVKKIYEELS
ncbi:tetratricopeptide repeat protein [Chlamydiota bacterium]